MGNATGVISLVFTQKKHTNTEEFAGGKDII